MELKTARRLKGPQILPHVHGHAVTCNAQSIVLTLQGEQPAHTLTVGSKVITRDSGTSVIKAIRKRSLRCDAVQIMAGSLGHRRPPEDTILPEDTLILLRDWRAKALTGRDQALLRAGELVDDEFITALPTHQMDIIELEFEHPHVIYAGGLELGSHPLTTTS